jgi:hypothetical protein
MPADGGRAVQITRNGGNAALTSADGRYLYYSKGEISGVWRLSLSDGGETEVVRDPTHWQAWTLGRRGLYYGTIEQRLFAQRQVFTIHYLDFERGRTVTLFRKEGVEGHEGLTVSPTSGESVRTDRLGRCCSQRQHGRLDAHLVATVLTVIHRTSGRALAPIIAA